MLGTVEVTIQQVFFGNEIKDMFQTNWDLMFSG